MLGVDQLLLLLLLSEFNNFDDVQISGEQLVGKLAIGSALQSILDSLHLWGMQLKLVEVIDALRRREQSLYSKVILFAKHI